MPSAASTWKSCALPTRQTVCVPALTTSASTSSFAAERPERLVMPKARNLAWLSAGAWAKKSLSVGFAPGQPPST